MSTLLAIDPGKRSGFALFRQTVTGEWPLTEVAVVDPYAWSPSSSFVPAIVVIECPERVYAAARVRDILKLARVVGRYEFAFRTADVHIVAPRDWKGTIDGDIMVNRVLAAMTPAERDLVKTKAKDDHNVVDAVGLGKWALRQPWMRARRDLGA